MNLKYLLLGIILVVLLSNPVNAISCNDINKAKQYAIEVESVDAYLTEVPQGRELYLCNEEVQREITQEFIRLQRGISKTDRSTHLGILRGLSNMAYDKIILGYATPRTIL